MKIQKFNEVLYPGETYESQLKSDIYSIISYEIELESIPYSDDMCISDKSMEIAATKIIEYLKAKKDLQVYLDSDKYNL